MLDLKGRWLLPGFVDAHTHLRDLKTARMVLASGMTSARNLGIERFSDVGIRELNHAGMADLPDVVAAGRIPINEMFFLDVPQLSDLVGGVHGAVAMRRVVRAPGWRVLPVGRSIAQILRLYTVEKERSSGFATITTRPPTCEPFSRASCDSKTPLSAHLDGRRG